MSEFVMRHNIICPDFFNGSISFFLSHVCRTFKKTLDVDSKVRHPDNKDQNALEMLAKPNK